MAKVIVLILFLLELLRNGYSARILAIIPTPAYSHQTAHARLWSQLSQRGHQVTVLTTHPQNRPELTNLTEIDLSDAIELLELRRNEVDLEKLSALQGMRVIVGFLDEVSDLCFSNKAVQDLAQGKHGKFDVVIVEYLHPEFLVFGEIFDAPTIFIGSTDAPKYVHDIYSNSANIIIYPSIFLPYSGYLSFKERLVAFIFNYYFDYFRVNTINTNREKILAKHFKDIPLSIERWTRNVSMFFVNVNPLLIRTRAVSANTIIIGGGNHINPPEPLPEDIKDFLDKSDAGAIYFSLGSTAQTHSLDDTVLENILQTFRELPYNVLWKFESKRLKDIPPNVKLLKWAPQQDILRHPNIKLFVTQAGLQSLEEAIYSKVPMVGLPIYGDQKHNANLMENRGILKVVPIQPKLEKDALKSAIEEVIGDPKYKNNIEKLLELTLDQPMTGLDKAIWWTEHVIRHRGANHLVYDHLDLPYYQFYYLDIISFLIGLTFILMSTVIFICKRIFRKTPSINENKKQV